MSWHQGETCSLGELASAKPSPCGYWSNGACRVCHVRGRKDAQGLSFQLAERWLLPTVPGTVDWLPEQLRACAQNHSHRLHSPGPEGEEVGISRHSSMFSTLGKTSWTSIFLGRQKGSYVPHPPKTWSRKTWGGEHDGASDVHGPKKPWVWQVSSLPIGWVRVSAQKSEAVATQKAFSVHTLFLASVWTIYSETQKMGMDVFISLWFAFLTALPWYQQTQPVLTAQAGCTPRSKEVDQGVWMVGTLQPVVQNKPPLMVIPGQKGCDL